ncbi:hypothetical protein AFK68_23225 [Hydrocoleum sp. CS-953]|nr:hypothetical protein AFK68_23225 [Hydrocoleum sp. CS-953]
MLSGGFNVGDENKDSLLNPGEEWIFTASETAKEGLQTNLGTAMGLPVNASGDPLGLADVEDSDFANYTGIGSKVGGDDDDDGFSHFILGDDDDDDGGDFSKYLAGDDDDDDRGSSGTFYQQDDAYPDDHPFSYFFSEGD